jgi:phage baseplate assembly protein W
MAALENPHLGHPYVRGSYVEQDSPEHILACQARIVACPVGFRVERPEFGWPFPTYNTAPLNLDALTAALRRFEPRAPTATGQEWADAADFAVRHIQITSQIQSEKT